MSAFISDLHLGSRQCQADRLLNFLRDLPREDLFLVGDVFDDVAVKNWPRHHLDVVSEILSFSNIYYTPGNHDSSVRQLIGLDGRIQIWSEGFYQSGDKKFLVTHGDLYDPTMVICRVPRWLNRLIRSHGNWSVWHTDLLTDIVEHRVVRQAKKIGCDGVICGHTHSPNHELIDGIEYINCGDWITNCTAVIDHGDGDMQLINT